MTAPDDKRFGSAFQERFVWEYLRTGGSSPARAYVRAGGQSPNPSTAAQSMLKNLKVQEAIKEYAAEHAALAKVDAVTVLRELMAIATVDIGVLFDEKGKVLPLEAMPFEARKAVSSIEVEALYAGKGGEREQVGTLTKVKLWDRTKALDSLGRHLGLFIDRTSLENPDGSPVVIDDESRAARIAAILESARRRRDGEDTGEHLV